MTENPDVYVMELKLYQNRLRVVAQELIAKETLLRPSPIRSNRIRTC